MTDDMNMPGEEREVFTPGLATLDSDTTAPVTGPSKVSGPMVQYTIVAVVCAIGVALLFWMRKEGLGPSAAMADMKIEYPLEEGGSAVSGEQREKVMNDLSRLETPVQVPGEAIDKNPFVLVGVGEAEAEDVVPSENQALLEEQRRRQRLKSSAESLRLGTVIGGAMPMAIISGKAYRVGDEVAPGLFLESAEGRVATVAAQDGTSFTLTMDE